MSAEATQHWAFNHVGVVVDDMAKAADLFKSLGIFGLSGAAMSSQAALAWPAEVEIDGAKYAVGDEKQMVEYTAYGEYVIKDGGLVAELDPNASKEHTPNLWLTVGPITFEVIRPFAALPGYHLDSLKKKGPGINHIAYSIDAEHYDEEVEKMKAKGLDVIETGIIRAEAIGTGRFVSYEYMYFDTREAGGFPIELMRPAALR